MKINKVDKFLDAVFGNKVKGRWIKVLASATFFIILIVGSVFLLTNVGCNEKGVYLKPWDVKVNINGAVSK